MSDKILDPLDHFGGSRTWAHQAYLQSRLYTTTEGLEALVRILGHELNITCRSCALKILLGTLCPVHRIVSCNSTHKVRVGGKISKCDYWISKRRMPGVRREADAWKYV